MKNMYEVFEEFSKANTKEERVGVIEKNLSDVLITVLRLTFHPDFRWKLIEFPPNYKRVDIPRGMGYAHLGTELRRLQLFQDGMPTAEILAKNPKRQSELLLQFLESIEPEEAKVVMGIFKKELNVKGLTYDFVKHCFPLMLP